MLSAMRRASLSIIEVDHREEVATMATNRKCSAAKWMSVGLETLWAVGVSNALGLVDLLA